ncbi:MAG: cytochrome c oxidase subunit 3 [Maribacter sp.]|jgi:cytochrome c oxidase subunit 3
MKDYINKEEQESEYYEYDPPLFQPAKILITLVLASLTMLFLFLSFGYLYTRIEQGTAAIQLPIIFILNTFVLLGSSYMIHRANKAYIDDDTKKYKRSLISTILLTLMFMLLQIGGSYQLMASNEAYFSASDNARSYLQLISAFHFIHVFAGLPFLVLFYNAAKKRMVEPVSVLVYFSDPEKRSKLKLLTIYWHFIDILWIYLVLFFFFTGLF